MKDVSVRYRIKSSQEILEIKRFGKSFSDSNFVLVFIENELDYSRYAVISSKAVGGAVQRNRCKRRLRSRAEKLIHRIESGYDLLLIAREKLLTVSPKDLDNSVYRLLKRADLLENE